MSQLTFTSLIAAGAITEDDDILGFVEGMDLDQSKAVALWLALATKGPVQMQFMDAADTEGWVDLSLTYEQALEKVKRPPG